MVAPAVSPKASLRRRLKMGCLWFFVVALLATVVTEFLLRRTMTHMFGSALALRGMYQTVDAKGDGQDFGLTPDWSGVMEHPLSADLVPVRINDLGRRGVASLAGRGKEAKHIVVYGDERVFGMGLPYRETMPAQLQALLRVAMPDVPLFVENAGVPGYGTRAIAAAMRRDVDRRADAVVVCLSLANDALEDSYKSTAIVGQLLFQGPAAHAARESFRMRMMLRLRSYYVAERFLAQMVSSSSGSAALDPAVWPAGDAGQNARRDFPTDPKQWTHGLFFDRRVEEPVVRAVAASFAKNLAEIVRAAGAKPVLLVLVPSPSHVTRLRFEEALRAADLDVDEHKFGSSQKRLLQIAASLSIPCLDLTAKFRSEPMRDGLWWRDLWTPLGCQRVAKWLVAEVQALAEN